MNQKIILLTAISMALTACSKEELFTGQNKDVELSVDVKSKNETATKAIIKETYLPDKATIGLVVEAAAGGNYDGISYNNIPYTATRTGNGQKWDTSSSVLLSSTIGKVYAYYPYSSSVTDITKIPVSTENTVDYMYAEPVTGISNNSPVARINMKHALAAIGVKVLKGTYTGSANMTTISIASQGFGDSGTLNAKTGLLSNIQNISSDITWTGELPLSSNTITVTRMVVPTTAENQNISFKVTVDGQVYTMTEMITGALRQGYIYEYTLMLNGEEMRISSTTVTGWIPETGNGGELETE